MLLQSGQSAGQRSRRGSGQRSRRGSGQRANRQAGQKASRQAGQKASRQAVQRSSQRAGQRAGQQAGQRAGQRTDQRTGQRAGQRAVQRRLGGSRGVRKRSLLPKHRLGLGSGVVPPEVRAAAADVFDALKPLERRFRNPCFRNETDGALRCLPYFSIIGELIRTRKS